MVIVPDPSLRVDQVKLPYMCTLELFKYEIIAYLSKMNDISESKAYEEWFYARISYSSKVYELMKLIIKKHKPKIILNRNPTINFGSLLCMKVVGVNKDYEEDYTASLPIQILPVLNADKRRCPNC